MNIVFFGSSNFSIPILKTLLSSEHRVALVVTIPARKKGRGQQITESPIALLAKQNGITVISPENLKDPSIADELKSQSADCHVIASYGKMIPSNLLSLCKIPLNVHPSLLPKYRGASPIISQLLDGVRESGVSIARVTNRLDAGEILSRRVVSLDDNDDAETAETKLAGEGAQLLIDVLRTIQNKTYQLQAQDESAATYVSKICKDAGKIDWGRSVEIIHNQIRAYKNWPTAFTFWKGKRIKIIKSRAALNSGSYENRKPGTVCHIAKTGSAIVRCGSGALEIIELQAESGKPMTPHAFSIGNLLAVGDQLE